MPRSSDKEPTTGHKKKSGKSGSKSKSKPTPRQDLPDAKSIIDEVQFTSPKGRTYRIIVTNEVDEYEEPKHPPKKRRK